MHAAYRLFRGAGTGGFPRALVVLLPCLILGSMGTGCARHAAEQMALTIPGSDVQLVMRRIPTGTFTMGGRAFGPPGFRVDGHEPAHKVTISKSFYMCVYPITQRQWKAVMGTNPSHHKGRPDHPVEMVSWNDSQEFIRKLGKLGLDGFRLPTEAEWEYACRAGTTTLYYWGDDVGKAGDYVWQHSNAAGETHPVGRKKPNAWGLYDMNGNVWEWCGDRYGRYSAEPRTDPIGAPEGTERVVRGGSYGNGGRSLRSDMRTKRPPVDHYRYYGFRLAREIR
jgi:formylglycine-generating enzyme required for sulfatase activity